MLRYCRAVMLVVLYVLMLSRAHVANAEDCAFIGCVGDIGYVFIPWTQQRPSDQITQDGVSFPNDHRVFEELGIPLVNEIVALFQDTRLFWQSQVEGFVTLEEFSDARILFDSNRRPKQLFPGKVPEGGIVMDKGAKVRILGYRVFSSRTGIYGQLLFALIRVESDGPNSP